MTTIDILQHAVLRLSRTARLLSTCVVLGALGAASVAFYLYACRSLADLQLTSPDQLARALAGL